MTRVVIFATLLLATTLLSAQPAQHDGRTEELLQMVAAKLPDDAILLQLKKSDKPVDLTVQDLIRLKQAGASDRLLNALQQGSAATPVVGLGPGAGESSFEEPDVLGVPFAIDTSTQKRLELERQNVNAGLKLKALGFAGGRSVVRFEGRKSPVRFAATPPIRFVIRSGFTGGVDPSSILNLDRLTPAKDHREATTVKVGPMGFGAKSTAGATEVMFKATTCGRSSLCFSSTLPLSPGEYVITIKDSKYGFLFGID